MWSFLAIVACAEPDDSDKPADSGEPADTDTGDSGAPAENQPPSAPVVSITPASPSDLSNLTATVVTAAVDPEGDEVGYAYAWSVDGTARADLSGGVVAAEHTADLETWTVSVTPNDGALDGPAGTATVTIANTPPNAPEIHIEPPEPAIGDDLTVVFDTPVVDPNGDTVTTTVNWWRGDTRLTDTGSTLDGTKVRGGTTYRVVVSVTDTLSDPVTAEASVTTPNTPPTIAVEITPAEPRDDDDLVAQVTADDDDGTEPTVTYQWFRDGVEATDVGNTDTVPASLTTIGETWDLTAYANDGTEEVSDAAASVEIRSFMGYIYAHNIDVKLTTDAAGATTASGTWDFDVESHSRSGTDNECDILWSLAGTENTTACPGCDWAFDTTATYDASLSSVITGCAALMTDGSGMMTWNSKGPSFEGRLFGPSVDTGWYSSGSVSVFSTGTGGYSYGGSGYTFARYYETLSTVDSAGNTLWSVYYYTTSQY